MSKFLSILVMLMIAGCGSEVATPTLVPAADSTPLPTKPKIVRTATPSPTPIPTDTPIPTNTPIPTPTEIPCSVQSLDFMENIESMAERWDDAVDLASSTPRISLAGPIASLQELKREANRLEAPSCSVLIEEQFILYIEAIIDAFLSFAASDPEESVARLNTHALHMSNLFEYYMSSVDTLVDIEPRYFIIVYGPGKRMKVSYNVGKYDSDEVEVSDTWVYEIDREAEFPISVEVSSFSRKEIMHVCAIYLEAEQLESSSSYSFYDIARCTLKAP